MDTSAGISLRPSLSLLCMLSEAEPIMAASAKGYREGLPTPAPIRQAPQKRRGIAGLFGRRATEKPSYDRETSPFPFDRAGELLEALMAATPPDVPRRVCVAIPAYAHDGQRQAVADGARAAGWDLLALVNEPTAAAMASGVLRKDAGTALVYDLSEDRFDVSIAAFRGIDVEILAADGVLTTRDCHNLTELLATTEAPSLRALKYAGIDARAIDAIVLVGETTRDLQTVEFVTQLFGQPPWSRFDPEEIVGIGAAIAASIIESH